MADISIQFHALPKELRDFVRQFVQEFHPHVVALRFRPFAAREVSGADLDDCFSEESPCHRLHFTTGEPVLPVEHELDFGDKNPSSLRLDIGAPRKDGLEQSWLSARTDDPTALAVWKKVAKRLKGMTVGGATAINPDTGASGPAKWHRFTEGARRLDANGTNLVSLTGIIMKPPVDAGGGPVAPPA